MVTLTLMLIVGLLIIASTIFYHASIYHWTFIEPQHSAATNQDEPKSSNDNSELLSQDDSLFNRAKLIDKLWSKATIADSHEKRMEYRDEMRAQTLSMVRSILSFKVKKERSYNTQNNIVILAERRKDD